MAINFKLRVILLKTKLRKQRSLSDQCSSRCELRMEINFLKHFYLKLCSDTIIKALSAKYQRLLVKTSL